MIRELGESGVTVLLSSHILAEVQQVCHSVSIIGNGRLLASGAVDDLVGEQSVTQVRVGVADPLGRRGACSSAPGSASTRDGDRLRRRGRRPCRGHHPGRWPSRQIYVRELTPVRADLESVFLQLTADAALHATGPSLPGRTGLPDRRDRRRCRMRLLRVELSRFCSRRAVVAAAAVGRAADRAGRRHHALEHPPDQRHRARRGPGAGREQMSQPDFQRDLQTCRDDPEQLLRTRGDRGGLRASTWSRSRRTTWTGPRSTCAQRGSRAPASPWSSWSPR